MGSRRLYRRKGYKSELRMGSDNRQGAAGDIVNDGAEVVIIPVLVADSAYALSRTISHRPAAPRRTRGERCSRPPVCLIGRKASALTGVLTLKERHGHDLEIKNQTPIFHVPDVVINPLG
jgi:hypothetical protein